MTRDLGDLYIFLRDTYGINEEISEKFLVNTEWYEKKGSEYKIPIIEDGETVYYEIVSPTDGAKFNGEISGAGYNTYFDTGDKSGEVHLYFFETIPEMLSYAQFHRFKGWNRLVSMCGGIRKGIINTYIEKLLEKIEGSSPIVHLCVSGDKSAGTITSAKNAIRETCVKNGISLMYRKERSKGESWNKDLLDYKKRMSEKKKCFKDVFTHKVFQKLSVKKRRALEEMLKSEKGKEESEIVALFGKRMLNVRYRADTGDDERLFLCLSGLYYLNPIFTEIKMEEVEESGDFIDLSRDVQESFTFSEEEEEEEDELGTLIKNLTVSDIEEEGVFIRFTDEEKRKIKKISEKGNLSFEETVKKIISEYGSRREAGGNVLTAEIDERALHLYDNYVWTSREPKEEVTEKMIRGFLADKYILDEKTHEVLNNPYKGKINPYLDVKI